VSDSTDATGDASGHKIGGIVRTQHAVLRQLLAEARAVLEAECCGLLAGHNGVISVILPARESTPSASAYEISPRELFEFFRRMRDEHLEHLGIYHSHPRGENSPSERDVALAYYPDAAYFIISPQEGAPRPVRAFRIADGRWSELTIQPI
jgi:[CysO sulfur-carrier protein]-S-L-cysteine hydrolase